MGRNVRAAHVHTSTKPCQSEQIIYRPLFGVRSIPDYKTRGSGGILRNNRLLCLLRDTATTPGENRAEVYFPEVIGPYGTWEWKAQITTPAAKCQQWIGFAEEAPIQYKDSIFVYHNGADYVFATYRGGAVTQTILAGQDWTVERTFMIEWTAAMCRLSVDGVVVSTHTTDIPNTPLMIFMEAAHNANPGRHTYIWGRDWVQLV